METKSNAGERIHAHANPEFTTRPRRLLMIGRMTPGHEGEVLEAHGRLPVAAAASAGIEAIEAFVGSGHYAVMLEIDREDAQEALAAYLNDPRVREFHASLEPHVNGLPVTGWQYVTSDPFHDDGGGADARDATAPLYSSADLPLAASMFKWRNGG